MSVSYLTDEEEEVLVQRVWDRNKEEITKSVESAIRYELSTHMNTRARKLVRDELDALIKPEIERRRDILELRVRVLGDRLLAKVEEVVHEQMRSAISDVVDYQFGRILKRATDAVHHQIQQALKDSVGSATNG